MFHYRTQTGQEVDILLEDDRGRVAAIEVKAAATVQERDVRTLLDLAETLGKRFVRGVVLYTGDRAVPFSDKVVALPMANLWRWREGAAGASKNITEPPPGSSGSGG